MSFLKSKHSGWLSDGTRTPFMGGGGSGGGTQQSTGTTYTSNIPEYARPYVETMLGATQKQLFDMEGNEITGFKPYVPYSTDVNKYVAGFQPLQERAMGTVGQMQVPGQFGQASDLAGISGLGSLGIAGRAAGAGEQYALGATNPNITQAYMSPYMQNVVDYQKSQALRDFQIGQPMRKAQAVGQGAFGGSRQAIMEAEAERSLGSQLQGIAATGSQKAFEDAQRQQQFGAQLGMQGLQTGLQGYGQMGQAASTLGGLGSQQFGAQKDIVGLQSQFGREQQALEQQKINQAIQDFANAQQYPLMQLGVMSNMLRGLPMQSQTTNQYVASPNSITQGIGLAGAGASIFNALKREGGVIKEMASGGITSIPRYDVGGSIRAKLETMPLEKLQEYKSESPTVQKMVEEILRDKTGKAGGGIIAFKDRGEVEDPDMVRQAYIDAARERAENSPTFGASVAPRAAQRAPLTEKAGRALGIKDAGRQVPTRETTAMPLQASGSDVPMVVGSSEYREALGRPSAPSAPVEVAPRAPGLSGVGEFSFMDMPIEDSRRAPTRGNAMPLQASGSDVPMVIGSQAIKDAVNPKSIVAATPKAESKAETKAETKPEAKPEAKPEGKANIKTAPVAATTPGAGIKDVPGLQRPVAPVDPDAGKTIAQIAAEKEAYMGPNVGAQEARAKLMAERANAADEARRTSALRMVEFFGAWGSTPGQTIVAGLNTLKNKVPDLISDMKEETKIRRQIDKDISEIEKIERLEKSGNYDEAAKRKAKLGDNALQKYGYDIKAYSDAQQTSAYLKAAEIKGPGGSGAGSDDRTLANLIGKRNDINKAITTASDKLRTGVKLKAAQPDSKDPKEQEKILAARAEVAKATGNLENDLKQINSLINTYQKVQGAQTPTPGTGAPGTTGNPIVLK
jgi:hypothetical protein